ncbi:glucose 1-dehydrogenase [Streptomyces sp. AM8-1-1]|uniref:SDR family NAD(P)-dependent oxidoreductase n=1 Tax=Streptomyces sp. AM8-1-1 TaxID=3075825 RepID=UPI0028C450C9|nr:glucose 1-dehydrogenase [Streptomyces sp. AM8-1-1]WNO76276.1 SDR family oxidoreductase [Streptomyces sp. AM8-1-1]
MTGEEITQGNHQGMLAGQVAMITGASSGIGAAAAHLFAQEGAAVVLMARRAEKLRAIAEEITAKGGRALAVPGDVADSGDVRRVVEAAVEQFGGLDCAFNNAGYATVGTLLHETEDEIFDRTMDVNVRGVWNCMKHQLPVMLASGRGGSVVNTSSTAGRYATGASVPYVAAKHAILGITRAAAAEYGAQGIRVNALVVGTTRSEMIDEAVRQFPHLEQAFIAPQIQKRMADPREIAEAAVWLCSGRASFVTGTAMPVDGGISAQAKAE